MPGKTKRASSTFRRLSRRSKMTAAKGKMGGRRRRITNRRLRRRKSSQSRRSMRYYGRGGHRKTGGGEPVETNLDTIIPAELEPGQSHRWLEEQNKQVREEQNKQVREEPEYIPTRSNDEYEKVYSDGRNRPNFGRALPNIPPAENEYETIKGENEYETIKGENEYETIKGENEYETI